MIPYDGFMHSSARFYFADINTGAELADHPLNGAIFEGEGPWHQHEGNFVHGHKNVLYVTEYVGGRQQTRKVTCADFDGRCVRVKFWCPNPDYRSTFVLVPETWVPRRRKAS